MMVRIFLALPVDPAAPVEEKMRQLQQLLGDYSIKWVNMENFHLTLFFFGDIPHQLLPPIKKALRHALKKSPALSFKLAGPALFKKGKEARVLYLGVDAQQQLFEVKNEVDKAVAELGFKTDDIPFRPHVTLGRFRSHQEVTPELENILREAQFDGAPEYRASQAILYQSKQFPSGPLYIPVTVFPLNP